MYMYRAINTNDFNKLKNENQIVASALYEKPENKFLFSTSLDTLVGHINGQTLAKNKSFWISSSKILDLVVTEYAIPQNGKYNLFHGRKPVAVIKGKEKDGNATRIIREEKDYFHDEIDKSIRTNKIDFSYLCLDLSDKYLGCLLKEKVIVPLRNNPYNLNDETTPMPGIVGFASKPKEVLHFAYIPSSMIRGFLTPLASDILYPFMGRDDDNLMEQFFKDIESNNSKIKLAIEKAFSTFNEQETFLFTKSYNSIDSYKLDFNQDFLYYTNTLDKIAKDNYKEYNIPFIDFYIKLKQIKKDILNKIYKELINLNYFNQVQLNHLKYICKNISLVDDRIFVLSTLSNKIEPPLPIKSSNLIEQLKNKSDKEKRKILNDLIMIEDEQGSIIESPISTDTFTKTLKK